MCVIIGFILQDLAKYLCVTLLGREVIFNYPLSQLQAVLSSVMIISIKVQHPLSDSFDPVSKIFSFYTISFGLGVPLVRMLEMSEFYCTYLLTYIFWVISGNMYCWDGT